MSVQVTVELLKMENNESQVVDRVKGHARSYKRYDVDTAVKFSILIG